MVSPLGYAFCLTASVSRPGLRGTWLHYTENGAAEQDDSENVGRPWVGCTLGYTAI